MELDDFIKIATRINHTTPRNTFPTEARGVRGFVLYWDKSYLTQTEHGPIQPIYGQWLSKDKITRKEGVRPFHIRC